MKGNTRYIFVVHFSQCSFFQYADLRRFCLEAQYNHLCSFVAGFPKLLKADPPASGKGARSWHLAVFLCILRASSPSPSWPTLDDPEACHHCLGLCFSKNTTSDSPFKKQPPWQFLFNASFLRGYFLPLWMPVFNPSINFVYDTDLSCYPISKVLSHLNPIIINSKQSQQ